MMKQKGRILFSVAFTVLIGLSVWGCNQKKQEKEPKLEPVEKKRAEIEKYQNLVAVGNLHMLGVKADGTVYSWGENKSGECNTQDWTDIVAVSANDYVSAGLKSDGTVVATGLNDLGQCETGSWTDIIEISACNTHILGLKSDGTVVSTGKIVSEEGAGEQTIQTRNEMVKDWKNIKHVLAYKEAAIGIKEDGTTMRSFYTSSMPFKNEVQTGDYGVDDIIELKREAEFWMGLTADGLVKLDKDYEDLTGEEWTDIVDIATGSAHYVGLRSNGRVLCSGSNEYKQCEGVESWKDILAIYAGNTLTVGLKEDGTLEFSGDTTKYLTENPEKGQTDPKKWDLF